VGGDFGIHPMNLLTTALNDAVKANVVLKRIGSNNVIVVRIKYTSSNTRRLVDASSNGFEPDGHLTFFATIGLKIASGKRYSVGSVLDCQITRPAYEVVSFTPRHSPKLPCPVAQI